MSKRLPTRQNDVCFTTSELKSDAVCADGPSGVDFRTLHAELLGFEGYVQKSMTKLAPERLTSESVHRCALGDPILIPSSPGTIGGLGMRLPAETLTPERVAAQLGLNYQVRTLDVAVHQEGPHWTMHQWSLYWEARRPLNKEPYLVPPPKQPQPVEDEADSAAVTRKRTLDSDVAGQQLKGITSDCKKRLLEVLHLPIVGTPLEDQIQPPAAVCSADLLGQVWPSEAPSRPHISAFLRMSPAGAFTDFRLPGGGSGVWCHVVSGAMSLALCPPAPRNLAIYAAWATAARHSAVFLAPHCEGVIRVDLKAGDTLIIPPGWLHAVATTAAAVSVGGHFLLKDSLALHLEAGRMEEHLGVHPRARYPLFKQTMWYAAAYYTHTLQQLAGILEEHLQERVASTLRQWEEEQAARAAEAAVAAAEDGRLHGDSDSVMATSKAGTTAQKKAGQPTSVHGGICNQPEPGVSTGNRSMIMQHRRLQTAVPAVNSKPGAAPPSATALAMASGEQQLHLRKRKRHKNSSFIIESDSEESGGRLRSTMHKWPPGRDCGSAEEDPVGEEPAQGGDDAMSAEEGARSPVMGSTELTLSQRRRAAPEAAYQRTPAPHGTDASAQGRKTTRFKGSLPPKLAAMLQTFSGEDSPPHHPEAQVSSDIGGGSLGPKQIQHHHDTAATTTTSAHKPIRLKVKLRALETQPPAGSSAPGSSAPVPSPRSGTPCRHSASPRKLVVKISKAGHARSPSCNGSARGTPRENHRSFKNGAEQLLPPTSTPGTTGLNHLKGACDVPTAQLPLQPQQLREQSKIPQLDGAGDEGEGDSTAAVGSPPHSPPPAAAQQQQQQQPSGRVLHRCNSSQSFGGGELPAQPAHAGLGASVHGSPVHRSCSPPIGNGAQQQGHVGSMHAIQQRCAPPAGCALSGDAVQDEYARMYAELEEVHHGGGDVHASQPAESGGSVGGEAHPAGAAVIPDSAGGGAGGGQLQTDDPENHQQEQQGQPVGGGAGGGHSHHHEQPGVSAAEAEGLAALLATLRKWMAAHNALNDVPLLIRNPKEVLAGLEVCMEALGLPLIPPPHVDLDTVPLDGFCRQGGAVGTAPTTGGSRPPRSLLTMNTSQYQAEVEGVGEEAGESMDAAFDVVVEESMGPESRPEAGGSRLTGRIHPPGRQKKLSVKNRLMKKLHFK